MGLGGAPVLLSSLIFIWIVLEYDIPKMVSGLVSEAPVPVMLATVLYTIS